MVVVVFCVWFGFVVCFLFVVFCAFCCLVGGRRRYSFVVVGFVCLCACFNGY